MRRAFLACLMLFVLSTLALAQPEAEKALLDAGFVEPSHLDKTLVLDMRYATTNNFTGKVVYPSARCFLRADVAKRLLAVQAALRKQGLGLKLFDCYRPFSVQERFWAIEPDERYVARPERKDGKILMGSKHNRGAAVDVSLVDKHGKALPMPSGFDDFTDKAHRDYQGAEAEALKNRATLEAAMAAQGFEPLSSEWWHFDGPSWQGYKMLDLPLPK